MEVMLRRLIQFLVAALSRTPVMRWFRTARGYRDQYVDPQVRQLRTLIGQLRSGKVDVLYLGDSSATFFGPADADQRRLPQMLAEELGMRVGVLAGAGYGPELYSEVVRLLATLDQRPKAVVLSRAVRISGATHVVAHPEYGYRRSIETLRKVPDAQHHLRAFSRANRRSPAEYDAFHALPVSTRWGRAETIGGFLSQVRGRRNGPEDLEKQRVLFDYFYGETFDPDLPALGHLRLLGERLREYCPVVVHYWPPIPVEKGDEYFPGEFEKHVRANFDLLNAAFEEGLGPRGRLVETPLDTPDEEFIDSADGSEHWNAAGRLRIARRIAEEIRAGLAEG